MKKHSNSNEDDCLETVSLLENGIAPWHQGRPHGHIRTYPSAWTARTRSIWT